jgi:hypothetical protein
MPEQKVRQEEIKVGERHFLVTHIPTATSGCWYVIHDIFEVWAAVAIDLDGTIVGWRNPPDEELRLVLEPAIRKAFDIPRPSVEKRKEYTEGERVTCPTCNSDDMDYEQAPNYAKCNSCGTEFEVRTVLVWNEPEKGGNR